MSAMIDYPIIAWKGKTFSQVTSIIRKNNTGLNRISSKDKVSMFLPPPLRIYRREIANHDLSNCYFRTSSSIDELNRPGGSIINSAINNPKGLVNTIDFNYVNNTTEHPSLCKTASQCVENNAKRRVRSSGMIKKQFDISKNNDTYHTNTKQYLVSRNRTFQQNQYNFIRQGDSTAKPGDALSVSNIYSPNGLNHCKKYVLITDVSFQYQWIDATYNTVTIPAGSYSIEDINIAFQYAMDNNYHYYVKAGSSSHTYLLNIAYNTFYKKIELQVTLAGSNAIDLNNYSLPINEYRRTITSWSTPAYYVVPGFEILSNQFSNAIGFTAGLYPSIPITSNSSNSQAVLRSQSFYSTFTPGIQPLYKPLYYKPSNPQFAQQGGVSASSLITRVRYNAITENASVFYNALGKEVGNALAYGVPDNGYTIKDKIGFPLKKTPVFSKYSNGFKTCYNKSLTH